MAAAAVMTLPSGDATIRPNKEPMMADHTTTTIAVRGCNIKMMRGGSGPPLLFLHGASGAAAWLPFMQSLSARFDVIVPQHPGFNDSDTPDWLDTIHDLAYFYLDFMEQLDLDRVHLVGASLGGWIAAEIAVRDTYRLSSLTLVGAAGIHVPGAKQVDLFLGSDEQRIRDFFHDPACADEMIARILQPEFEDANMKNRIATAKLAWQPRAHDPNLRKWLHRIDVPTLIIWGANDRVFPMEYAYVYQTLISGSKAVIIPECGHIPQVEKRDMFVAELTGFIDGMRKAA
jgi:pimeloyl-ACP methyl ester carboxylesterase